MMHFEKRLAALDRLADGIASRRDELEELIVDSFKRPRREAAGEVDLALSRLRSFASLRPYLEQREARGTVAFVLPGNAALSNPIGTIGTAFLCGNQVLARFPSRSRRFSEVVEPLFKEHLPGVYFDHRPGQRFLTRVLTDAATDVVMVFGDDAWIRGYEPLVRRGRKTLIFEGPGKDPFVVLPGADLEKAARDAVRGACWNAGQACTSPERFYVYRALFAPFVARVVELCGRQVVGDPRRQDVTVGPIVSRRLSARIVAQLAEARQRGARFLCGGGVAEATLDDGTAVTWVEPTVVTDLAPDLALLRRETMGPIIPVQPVDSRQEALERAAASDYGLTACLYGGTREERERLAQSHGHVFENEIWLDFFARNPHAPYGGRKSSGWVWSWRDGALEHRDGLRLNACEFSRNPKSNDHGEVAETLCATIPIFLLL